jgi:hypothetical protein
VDPDVEARPRHREREHQEGREAATEEVAEDDSAGEARRGMARGEGAGDRAADERLDTGQLLERARAVGGELDGERQEVGAPDARGRECGRRQDRLLGEHGEDGREQDPDEAREPDDGESDEDRVEPARAVLGDPEDYLLV